MAETDIEIRTKQLIDRLKATCAQYGLGNDGNEYKIITEVFLYKYMNDMFGHEVKLVNERLDHAKIWDVEYDNFTEEEEDDLFTYLQAGTPLLRHEHTLSHLINASKKDDFADIFDATLLAIADLNADIFSMATSGQTKITIFEKLTPLINEADQRSNFAAALVSHLATFNFEDVFYQKYDFFSTIFEYLIKDYNKDGGGKYAEYYTPKAVATIMARMLVPDGSDLRSVTCYDPAAGSGTLLMALAHQIGEDRCQIYSQDISQKSSQMLRLNLILNHLVSSIQNIVKGDTLTLPYHKEQNGSLMKFDFVVSNPPFNLDFSDTRDTIAADTRRFFAGVPAATGKDKSKMAIYLCFVQHILYSLNSKGKAAIVVPTGFITAASGIAYKIRQRVIDEGWLRGVVSMPSNIFATTGTNVSVLFIDKANIGNDIILMDASKLGEKKKVDGNQRTILSQTDIDKIITTFNSKQAVDDFSVIVSADQIKEKNYSFSAGQYFDIKIEYEDITAEEFQKRIKDYTQTLTEQFAESHRLEEEILKQLKSLKLSN
ncbi:MAG: SAM-dependent DNA methyltransferase [Bacteroidales bacterium]|nr:SAM-dependent DNA methyltransferase [Bacteroidales bacterium]